jgi:hypothetical protein
MKNFRNIEQFSAKDLSDPLVSQTNAENTFGRAVLLDHRLHNPGLVRNSRARTQQYLIIITHVLQSDLIIPVNIHSITQRTDDVNEVVGKAVVVVEY